MCCTFNFEKIKRWEKNWNTNKAGSRKPGSKPKHLQNQHSIRGFFSVVVNDNDSDESSSISLGESSISLSIYTNLLTDAAPAEDDNKSCTKVSPSCIPYPLEVSNEVAVKELSNL